MLRIDNTLLQEVGLGTLPDADKRGLLKHIYETLEMRVGIRLADQMTNQQLDEFERYFEAKDDAGAFKWLESNFPNYKDIVQQEFDKLKAEVTQSAPQILSSSQAQAGVVQGQQAAPAQLPQQPDPTYAAPVADPQFTPPPQPQQPSAPYDSSQAPTTPPSPAPFSSPDPQFTPPPQAQPQPMPSAGQPPAYGAPPMTFQNDQPQVAPPTPPAQPPYPNEQPPAGPSPA